MNTTAATVEQFGTLSQIAQMYIREEALNLDSCNHYDFVVCPQRALTLLSQLHDRLYFSGNFAEDEIVKAILNRAEAQTQIPVHVVIQKYLVVQMLDYNLIYAKSIPLIRNKVKRIHERSFYG